MSCQLNRFYINTINITVYNAANQIIDEYIMRELLGIRRKPVASGQDQQISSALPEMVASVDIQLEDRTTQLVLETDVEWRLTTNVGFMVKPRPGLLSTCLVPYREGAMIYPEDQQAMGIDGTGGIGYRGTIIEGKRVRFLGDTPNAIDEISYATFIRRIPLPNKTIMTNPDWVAIQVLEEDEDGTRFRLSYDRELHGMQYQGAEIVLSDGTHGKFPFISSYGEKSIPPGYYGFILEGYEVSPNMNVPYVREAASGILAVVDQHRQEAGEFLKQEKVRELLAAFESFC